MIITSDVCACIYRQMETLDGDDAIDAIPTSRLPLASVFILNILQALIFYLRDQVSPSVLDLCLYLDTWTTSLRHCSSATNYNQTSIIRCKWILLHCENSTDGSLNKLADVVTIFCIEFEQTAWTTIMQMRMQMMLRPIFQCVRFATCATLDHMPKCQNNDMAIMTINHLPIVLNIKSIFS